MVRYCSCSIAFIMVNIILFEIEIPSLTSQHIPNYWICKSVSNYLRVFMRVY
nr:MAG TPA: hypothetical protein [Bacteriophage sp.]